MARRRLSGPALLSGTLIVADFEGYLHALSQVDGRLVARTRVDSDGVRAPLFSSGEYVYAFGNSGKLTAYRYRD